MMYSPGCLIFGKKILYTNEYLHFHLSFMQCMLRSTAVEGYSWLYCGWYLQYLIWGLLGKICSAEIELWTSFTHVGTQHFELSPHRYYIILRLLVYCINYVEGFKEIIISADFASTVVCLLVLLINYSALMWEFGENIKI